MAVISLWQVYQFLNVARSFDSGLKRYAKPNSNATHGRFARLYHLSDVAGLHVIRESLKQVWQDAGGADATGDRYHSYLSRVPELIFQGWFSVTALMLIGDDDHHAHSKVQVS